MSLEYLSSADDPRVSDYTSLTDTSLRRRREPVEGMYIAESSKVLRRAVDAGHRPRSFFLAEKWLPDLQDILDRFPEVPAFVGTADILEEITGFHLHRGALAAMERPAPLDLAALLSTARRVAVLEDIVDHTNIGAIFRSAAALQVDAVLVTPRCADPLYRRAIRVSMGTVFQVPWVRLTDWPGQLTQLRDAGFVTAALALREDSLTLDELSARRDERLALILGTEGDGLSGSTLAGVDLAVRIPMSGGVDSLNVAAASAVAFWECRP
ncbi:RNA methyltransferase [Arthrobacter zhangbolii]|uniref:RNA methyltransferase n=1 Tax=Arthrobacter zhangbolii TaxID=2886936 RepID=A0A9X1M509_9MICC|nr:RNA methyltransferase [Arthrobacter zhangbolii]MCC3271509.1 RNA methyltransferase [Arthrobacter zhangbolii]MCC3293418.1 RNA methyltransferase [Arthrobacter zhangbolii]UON90722.1 RNA methyltransferase [Arthrobacter zhangbolii]